MDNTLLATKFFLPPTVLTLVARPRLLDKLKASLSSRLILVSAPAGFGKTTLLSQWIHGSRPPVPTAWLSLEDTENDPLRFWDYFTAALRTIHPSVGETFLSLQHSSEPVPVESALTTLINDLSAVSRDFVLVLDDYHFIGSPPVHRGVNFLLEHMPPAMHLVIATRADPPLALPHLRGRGLMLEIGADDLRFTLEEATGLLRRVLGIELPLEALRAINDRAEGWVVGLKMAALSLAKQKDVKRSIVAFTGSQRYIMDYLMDEVLGQQSPEVREFLLKTSILGRLSGPLCDAVTGRSDGAHLLREVERNHLFIVPLDESRSWYRYEHLFAELLLHRAEVELGKDGVAELQMRASRWYEANHLAEDAIDHALAAHDWDKAMALMSDAEVRARKTASPTMLNWLRQIPDTVLRANLPRYFNYIWSLQRSGEMDAVEERLKYLDGVAENNRDLQGKIASVRCATAWARGDVIRAEQYARKTLSLLAPDDTVTRSSAYRSEVAAPSFYLGMIRFQRGQLAEAEPFLEQSLRAFREAGLVSNTIYPLNWLGVIASVRGQLRHASKLFQEAIDVSQGDPAAASAHLSLGQVLYEWNDLKAAAFHHGQAVTLFRLLGAAQRAHIEAACLHLARTRMAMGAVDGAMEALEDADRFLPDDADARARNVAYHVAVGLLWGNAAYVSAWVDKLAEYDTLPWMDIPAPAANLFWAQKGEAAVRERRPEAFAMATQRAATMVIAVRTAQAVNSVKDSRDAMTFFAEALDAGRPEGYIRSFVDWGMELAPLLRESISRGVEPEYADKLLGLIEAEEKQRKIRRGETPTSSATKGLLSEREMEVLRLVAEGLSNQQIADKLTISLNTAKTHVYRAFDKLAARDRVQALKRARELKLI